MSTFDGLIEEFPDIRIDYFRYHPNKKQPAACFLSHVHSDHLLGLETLKMPFVYCSAATRRLLLKMEKYPHRVNFSKGILESRKQTYKHLKSILRPLPLQTPVDLELGPRHYIRVTLFDANHCPGAVMFLIEGNGRAILYTGDVRAEAWWVNAIVRSPILIPYTTGHKNLDCLYLDTTFASHRDIHQDFPTKAEGLAELIKKLSKCSTDTVFYFRAWTLGYEDVWTMLSTFLRSRIHVDQYQLRLFKAIAENGLTSDSGPVLAGFQVGNSDQPGQLTTDSNVRIHSCEPGMPCHSAVSKDKNTVWITPIISRSPDGTEMAEVGAGGGRGDLYQCRELDIGNDTMFEALRLLVSTLADNQDAARKLESLMQSARNHQDHRLIFDSLGPDSDSEVSLKDFVKMVLEDKSTSSPSTNSRSRALREQRSNTISFPYSRHSSYSELCDLVQRFQPKDICPCTVDVTSWNEDVSMKSLFGKFCSSPSFRYDQIIREEVQQRRRDRATSIDEPTSQQLETQQTETQTASQASKDVFRSFEEHVLQETNSNEQPATQIPSLREEAPQKFRDAWRCTTGDTSRYEDRILSSPCSRISHELSSLTSGVDQIRAESEDHHQSSAHDLDYGNELSDLEGRAIRPRKRLRISGNGPVSNIDGIDEIVSSFSSEKGNSVDSVRRREAYKAARVCLDKGDHSLWSAMGIRSLGHHDHQTSSPEL